MTNLDIQSAYVGTDQVVKVYLGTEVVWGGETPGPVPYEQQYLTFEFVEVPSGNTGGIVWQKSYGDRGTEPKTIQMRANGGSWVSLDDTSGPVVVSGFSVGDILEFRGYNTNYGGTRGQAETSNSLGPISGSSVKAYGNVMSLIDGDNFSGITEFQDENAFTNLFRQNPSSYASVKMGFLSDVENLILPVTAMHGYDYRYMFRGQERITRAPVLSAASLVGSYSCYGMFSGCTSLNYIVCLATSLDSSATSNWVSGVAPTGTFVKDANTTWPSGTSGIPTGWTVIDA